MFIQYLAEQGHNVVKSERKPRKTVQYKDLATAVSHIDNLEFLADVIPKTTTYKQFKEKKARETTQDLEKGQRTLNGATSAANANGGPQEEGVTHPEEPLQSPTATRVPVSVLIADRTVEQDNDVHMQG
ncbi:hypothetical protein N7470_008880 [Penicillium chermesinum]|nr:hypothetical protein N7470_008880 [Penicillium chermesinum]